MRLATEVLHYAREVAHGPVEVVVDDDTGRELEPVRLLQPAECYATLDVLLRVAPGAEPLLLHLGRRRANEHAVRVRTTFEHLASALDIYLQHDVAALSRLGRRRPVALTEDRRPLEEAAFGHAAQEGVAVDECIGVLRLTGTAGTRGP